MPLEIRSHPSERNYMEQLRGIAVYTTLSSEANPT